MAGRTEPSDSQLNERLLRHEEAKIDATTLDSLEKYRVDMEMVVKALLDLKDLFPPRLRKVITVKEFHNRCLMTRIEDDNQCLQDFLDEGSFELIDVLGDGNCGFYSAIVGLVWQRYLPLLAIRTNARLQASMLLLRKLLRNFMEKEADSLSKAIGRDSPNREACVYAAELDQESQSAHLSGLWDNRIPNKTYCKYLRNDSEAFLSAFAMIAIAALFKIIMAVHNATLAEEGNRVNVSTTIYDGTLYDKGVMKSLYYDSFTKISNSSLKRIEVVLFENHFMALRPKGNPSSRPNEDGILKEQWHDEGSGKSLHPLSPGLSVGIDRMSPPFSPLNQGLIRSPAVESPLRDEDLDRAAGQTSKPRFPDDPLLLKIREIRADPYSRPKAKRKSIVSFCENRQIPEARTRSEISKRPHLNTQLFHTSGIWYNEKGGIFKIGKQEVTDC